MEFDWLTYFVLGVGGLGLWLVYRQPREAAPRRGNLLVGAGVVIVVAALFLVLTVGLG